jgi:CheY-like chemotaxis protein
MTDPKLPSILVVDDNHDNADIIRDYLEARGYPITVAYDGDEAMKASSATSRRSSSSTS